MISQQLAQKVVNKIMEDVTYNINVMDKHAVIIASGQKERIGTIHQGARKVLETKKRNVILTVTETEKQGINDPLVVDDELIGVIGISGAPDKVEPLKNIVNTLFYFLVAQELEISRGHAKEQTIRQFWETILKPEVSYKQSLQKTALELGYNLSNQSLIIGLRLSTNKPDEALLKLINERLYTRNKESAKNDYFILFQETKESTLSEFINKLASDARVSFIAYSSWNNDIYKCYTQANATMSLATILNINNQIMAHKDYGLYTTLIASRTELGHHSATYSIDNELKETLQSYIRNNGQINDTANELNIHRNTLNYRLNRIAELTQKDPRHFFDLSDLLYELILEDA
ncbi:CdaR family transcriptional regulator [Vagococcus intermedius]|uniref:Helix-turn-helix domain-containing protein n=1 Tax=Vagococcus intermedius TaxID=2991418 RepID=A0AAF0CT07_9ENTE|nr:sugar diacid recognition domain-containing protein [Vagococcus intermedius]WEG72400.1 helix-turn-helix domain-containing protein [Vagococcus intermedius]WEG74488.1 helix-turn-helix domain-containing protein [Vagococcus intermedius]